MRPKQRKTTSEGDLFRARLDQIIDMKHELVQLAGALDWEWLEEEIAPLYSENGRPGIATHFVRLLLLAHIYGLSDKAEGAHPVVARLLRFGEIPQRAMVETAKLPKIKTYVASFPANHSWHTPSMSSENSRRNLRDFLFARYRMGNRVAHCSSLASNGPCVPICSVWTVTIEAERFQEEQVLGRHQPLFS